MIKKHKNAKFELNGVDVTDKVYAVEVKPKEYFDDAYLKQSSKDIVVKYKNGDVGYYNHLDFKITLECC